MRFFKSIFSLFLIPVLMPLLAAAIAVSPAAAIDLNPLSAIKAAVEAVVEDRSSSDIGKDLTIKTEITTKVIKEMGTDVISINADVTS